MTGSGGRGSESSYPPVAVEQARVLTDLLREHRNLDAAALELFMRRFDLPAWAVQDAYTGVLAGLRKEIANVSGNKDPFVVAEAVAEEFLKRAGRLPRSWRRRLRAAQRDDPLTGEAEPVRTVLESAVVNFVTLTLTGEPFSRQGLRWLTEAMGLAAATRESLPGSRPFLTDLALNDDRGFFAAVSLAKLDGAVRTVSLAELRQAREELELFMDFVAVFVPVLQMTARLPEALGLAPILELAPKRSRGMLLVPFAILRRLFPDEADEVFAAMRQTLPGFTAMKHLVERAPCALRPYLAPGRTVDELPEPERSHARQELDDLIARYPSEVQQVVAMHDLERLSR